MAGRASVVTTKKQSDGDLYTVEIKFGAVIFFNS
jgi:hypothetical protein